MDYNKLLDQAYKKLPEKTEGGERLEIPKMELMKEGNMVIIKNFLQVAQAIRRDPKHLLKYMSKELAAPGSFDGKRAIFQSRAMRSIIEKKFDSYVKNMVVCKECKRPDTAIVKEGRLTFIKCEACGAKYAAKS
ncbi:MAG: translation initiation factor IF-2 subunit beta [Candidatus Aenigmarchaeota archaeon]|nr:translation initiation factor IF-2 subunit beta [Candidatus Aenigmarchaeota archaeon]